MPRLEACARCEGKGAEPEDGLTTCPVCRGRGEVIYQQSFLSVRRTCGQCGGRGQIIRRPCKDCHGEGYLRTERKLNVESLPASTTERTCASRARASRGRTAGRTATFMSSSRSRSIRSSNATRTNCTARVPINIAQAALGTEIDLLTFDGLQTIKVPEGTQSGSTVRLRGLGVPKLSGSGRGDLIVHVDVRVPSKLTREQRKLFEQLRDLLPKENEPQEKGLFDKVKEYFM